MTILNFAGSGDDFAVSDSDVNIGISVRKGNRITSYNVCYTKLLR